MDLGAGFSFSTLCPRRYGPRGEGLSQKKKIGPAARGLPAPLFVAPRFSVLGSLVLSAERRARKAEGLFYGRVLRTLVELVELVDLVSCLVSGDNFFEGMNHVANLHQIAKRLRLHTITPQLRSGSGQWFGGSNRQQRQGQYMLRPSQLLPAWPTYIHVTYSTSLPLDLFYLNIGKRLDAW